jgi:hypothetical protein
VVRSLGTRDLWSKDLYQLTDEDFGALNFKPAGALVTCVNEGAHRKPFSNRNLDAILSVAPPTRTVVFIGGAFPTYLPWIRRPSGLRGRPANETYDAGLSLDVDCCIADNFVYSPGLGKHRHMA